MAAPAESLLHHLQSWLRRANADTHDDATLLKRFVSLRDESAFTALLARHGPMVHGICRRILRDDHEAEDAFQATFLLLARKAGALRHPQTLAAWLHGVARRLALTAQRSNCRRRQRERHRAAPALTAGNPLDELSARELLRILDDEIALLPERYRLPLILCGLEGRSQAEAAQLLGWTADSVRGRLERGRACLRTRLIRRGLTLSASLLLLESIAAATVSAALRQATVKKAMTFLAGSTEGIAASVAALAESGVTSMMMAKAKMGLMLLFALVLAGSAGVLAYPLRSEKQAEEMQTTAAITHQHKTEVPKPANDKAAPTDLYGDPLPSGAIARLGTVRFRHGGGLEDVLLSPDGRSLISAGDRSIDVWDAKSGRRLRQIVLSTPAQRVAGIDLSPDGKLLALSFQIGGNVRFWNLAGGTEVYPLGDADSGAGRATFSPDGNLLAKIDFGNKRTVTIWDVRKGKKIRMIEGGDSGSSVARCLAFSPDSKLLAFPHSNGVRIWDLAAGKELHQLDPGAKKPMGNVAFSADGKLLAASGIPLIRNPSDLDLESSIYLWDVATGKRVGTLPGHKGLIRMLAMSPKGNLLVSTGSDRLIHFWDLDKRQEIGRSSVPDRAIRALSFSADGSMLASGDTYGVLRIWDAQTHGEIAIPSPASNIVESIRFAPDGQTLISTATEQIGLWEPLTGRPRSLFKCPHLIGSLLGCSGTLSPDGKALATRSDRTQGQALLWDIGSGKLLRRFGENVQPGISSVAFSPDGRRLAGAYYDPGGIRVWDAASGKELLQLKADNYIHGIAFSPDGATLAASSGWANAEMTVRLWKLATGDEIWRKDTRPWTAFALQFSPDGRTLAAVGTAMPGQIQRPGEFYLWDSATGKERKHFEGNPVAVRRVAFSADGRMLATGSDDNTVRLWEVASGKERHCFQGHQSLILSVSFSPDGRLLASASADATALVWDLTGRFRDGRFQPRRLSVEERNRCWADLAHSDATRAYRSILALTGSPKEAVALLKDRLTPVTATEPKRVKPLLAALDSEQFAERDKATSELEQMGLAVEPVLHAALGTKPSLEVRRRIEAVLDKLSGGPRLRFLRALEVLEHIATAEARQLLESLSQGTAEMWPTQEAKASLKRLAARTKVKP